jgi:hypothetical protein
MARIFTIKELEARKRALADESDLYRQTLRYEIHNLSLHATSIKRRVGWLALTPLWPLLPPLINAFVKRKQKQKQPGSSQWRIFSTALAGWRLYQRFSHFLPTIFSRARRARLRDGRASSRI